MLVNLPSSHNKKMHPFRAPSKFRIILYLPAAGGTVMKILREIRYNASSAMKLLYIMSRIETGEGGGRGGGGWFAIYCVSKPVRL
jgi:hypothetical protein